MDPCIRFYTRTRSSKMKSQKGQKGSIFEPHNFLHIKRTVLILQIKAYVHPDLIVLPVTRSKARIVVFASRKAIPECWSLRRSCFTERRALPEAWIGGNISGCHCRQSSMLNNIGGARTRTLLKLTNRWRFTVLSWGVFRVEERIELIWHLYKKIGVNLIFKLRY